MNIPAMSLLLMNRTTEPRAQGDFTQQVVSNVANIEPGHQCYKIAPIPETVKAGTNATIQLEYWASGAKEQGGAKQSFFACADVVRLPSKPTHQYAAMGYMLTTDTTCEQTFVEAKDFTLSAPCFNVTTSDFRLPGPSGTAQPKTPSGEDGAGSSPGTSSSSGSGLTSGEKAGIAVGTVLGSFGVVGILAFMLLRKKRAQPVDVESPASAAPHKRVNDAMSERSA